MILFCFFEFPAFFSARISAVQLVLLYLYRAPHAIQLNKIRFISVLHKYWTPNNASCPRKLSSIKFCVWKPMLTSTFLFDKANSFRNQIEQSLGTPARADEVPVFRSQRGMKLTFCKRKAAMNQKNSSLLLRGMSFQKRYFRKFSTNRAKLMHIPHVECLLLLRFL